MTANQLLSKLQALVEGYPFCGELQITVLIPGEERPRILENVEHFHYSEWASLPESLEKFVNLTLEDSSPVRTCPAPLETIDFQHHKGQILHG